jgi:hypothetical protein
VLKRERAGGVKYVQMHRGASSLLVWGVRYIWRLVTVNFYIQSDEFIGRFFLKIRQLWKLYVNERGLLQGMDSFFKIRIMFFVSCL